MIRLACIADAGEIAAIYDDYARRTCFTFAENGPGEAHYANLICAGYYPVIVWEEDSRIAGFAYADLFRTKDAYRWDVELTLYLRPDCKGRGMGTRLMKALLALLREQHFLLAYSCITSSNEPSLHLHRKLDFTCLGDFPHTGYKHGRWHGVTWMQYALGNFSAQPQEPIPVSALAAQRINDILEACQ